MTTTDAILRLDATALIENYGRGSLSPVEALAAVAERIDAVEPRLNAFLSLHLDEAFSQAEQSAARWASGAPLGLFDGVPVSIKDHVMVTGWGRRNGSNTSPADELATYDSPAVARLRENGAVLFGKTTMTEFGWKGTSDSPLTGITRNPWNLSKTTGGSSSGAGAAVAAGIGPVALGTDGGGSVRIPAAFCGLFGLKASGGRVPYWPFSYNHTLTHLGPMTRSVRDGALMMTMLSRPDARDWYALPYQEIDYLRDLDTCPDGLRFIYAPRVNDVEPDPAILGAIDRIIAALSRQGQAVEHIELDLREAREIFETLYASGLTSTARALSEVQFEGLEPALKRHIVRGRALSGLDYTKAMERRLLLGHRMKGLFGANTILITPTTTTTAFDVGALAPDHMSEDDPHEWHSALYPFNLTLQPAANVPIGFSPSGLPIGLQVVGPMHADALVLRVCRHIEKIASVPVTLPAL